MSRKLGKVCPPPGMLPPPCSGEKFTAADKKKIMTEFAKFIPRAKLEAALDMVKSNHAEAARRADWVMSSVRDSEFIGARPRHRKKRKTRKKSHKRGGAPEWVENRVTTLIIMLAIGGSFWVLWPILEGTLITYGVLPELCGTSFAEHVGVMFGSMATHGAVLTCLARERQYRAVIGGILTALTGTGLVTRERVAENYTEVHTYVRNTVFGPGGLLGPAVPLSAATPPQTPPSSASWGSVESADSGSMPPLSPIATPSPQLSPAASASPPVVASSSTNPLFQANASPQGSQGGTRKRKKSKRGSRSRKHVRKTYRRLRPRKHRTGRH